MKVPNVRRLIHFARGAKARAMYRLLPGAVDWMVKAGTIGPRRLIAKANASRILIDNSVITHAVTHETAWLDTGEAMWGGKIPVSTGMATRIPVHSEEDASEAARSTRFLPSIASLACQGAVTLYTSPELDDERWTQPIGRYNGYGFYDHSLFAKVKLHRLDDPTYSMVLGMGAPSLKDQREHRFASKTDPLFKNLLAVLGSNNSQDAWHVASAEQHECFCFLTMDFALLRNLHAQRRNAAVASLTTLVMSPEQFGLKFKLLPVSPRLFSYHNASFPVNAELNCPDSKRQKPRRRRP